jgi:segregation and condensation protein B
MNEHDLKHIIEATLLAAGRPVPTQQLLDLFDERERPTLEQFHAAVALLQSDYESRGIELTEVASGWRIQVRPRTADVVSRLWQERPSRYSRALLETLALIAYRQPITRSEIEEIRGVSISSTIMRTLQERNWIRTVGHREVPGRPELLGTTREFLDYFGLKSLDQLPTLAELKDVETIGVQLELPAAEPPAAVASAEGADPATADAPADAGESTESNVEAEASAVESTEAQASDESIEGETESDSETSMGSNGGENNGDDAELMADADESESEEDGDESHTLVASSEDESASHEIREPRED